MNKYTADIDRYIESLNPGKIICLYMYPKYLEYTITIEGVIFHQFNIPIKHFKSILNKYNILETIVQNDYFIKSYYSFYPTTVIKITLCK